MAENKIKYGLERVYYAKATIASNGTATYDTPVAIPGAVSLSLDPQGENSPFYADNIVYYVTSSNTGYEGDLEIARIPDSFKEDIMGYVRDAKDVLVENTEAQAGHFALLFQFEGDVKATRHVLYNCTVTRPNISGQTKEDTIEPQTETMTLTATSVFNAALDKNVVKSEANDETDSTTYSGWYTAVYSPTPASTTT